MPMIPQAILAILNGGRADMGHEAYAWDDRLAAAGQMECDALAKHQGRVHDDLRGRLQRSGWPYDIHSSPPNHRQDMPGNASEGWLGCLSKTAEDAAYEWTVCMQRMPKAEGHRRDWEAGYNRVGVGFSPRNFVIMYGWIP
jgi:hypothetical protein